MSEVAANSGRGSGLISLTPEAIERLPDQAGYYRLRTSGQRLMFIGHSDETGLRETLRRVSRTQVVAGVATVDYVLTEDADSAAAAAEREINELKPLYNMGFDRFRNSDVSLPKTGQSIRKAMQNP